MSYRGVRRSLPRSSQLSQFSSARLGVTTYDLQIRKVITPSSGLCFGCSWTLLKAHLVKNSSYAKEDSRCQTEVFD